MPQKSWHGSQVWPPTIIIILHYRQKDYWQDLAAKRFDFSFSKFLSFNFSFSIYQTSQLFYCPVRLFHFVIFLNVYSLGSWALSIQFFDATLNFRSSGSSEKSNLHQNNPKGFILRKLSKWNLPRNNIELLVFWCGTRYNRF